MMIPYNRIPNHRFKFKDAFALRIRWQKAAIWTNVSKAAFKYLSVCLSLSHSSIKHSFGPRDATTRGSFEVCLKNFSRFWRAGYHAVNFTSEHLRKYIPTSCVGCQGFVEVWKLLLRCLLKLLRRQRKKKKNLPFFLSPKVLDSNRREVGTHR